MNISLLSNDTYRCNLQMTAATNYILEYKGKQANNCNSAYFL